MNMLTEHGIHLHTYMFIHQIGDQTIFLHRTRPVILWEYELSKLVFISDLNLPLEPVLRLGFIIHFPNANIHKEYGRVIWKESSTSVKAYQYGAQLEHMEQASRSITKNIDRNQHNGRARVHPFEYDWGYAHDRETGGYFDVTT